MPTKFWSDEPEDTRTIEQLIEEQEAVGRGFVTASNIKAGMRVRTSSLLNIGPDNVGGTYGDAGTITNFNTLHAWVLWDTPPGLTNFYRITGPYYDLCVLDVQPT